VGRLALVFPGQGSQTAGMGRRLFEECPESRRIFEIADDTLGEPLSRLIFEGPDEALSLTANTQPAVLTVSVAVWEALRSRGVEPDLVAGHSLGEYSALVAAGVLRFEDAVRLVRARGTYMQEAVPPGEGAMAAIVGLGAEEVAGACEEGKAGQVVSAANYNSPEQTVIAGHAAAVGRAAEICRRRGAKRVVPLPVSAPFHCALMRPAQERLAADLSGTEFRDALIPVVTNVDARPVRSGPELCDALVRQVTAPVRWVASIRRLASEGVDRIVEAGPGTVLCGLIRRIDRSIRLGGAEDPDSLARAVSLAKAG
jgi:[acyl-carrier-protein] S-malonyltransferase